MERVDHARYIRSDGNSVSWVQQDALAIKIIDGLAWLFAVVYTIAYVHERTGPARPRRMRSAAISAVGLFLFAILLAVRVYLVHE